MNNNDTIRIIKKIKLSKSKGHDGVSTELLKLINNDISNYITLIINQSLTSCIYPDSLKVAKVTPIYKKKITTKLFQTTDQSQYYLSFLKYSKM